MRLAHIPPTLDAQLSARWSTLSDSEKSKCASAIINMSHFFQQNHGPLTPWDDPQALDAYLFYFFPLNLARAHRIFLELNPLLDTAISQVVDMGAGLGNFRFLKDCVQSFQNATIHHLELNTKARNLSEDFGPVNFTRDFQTLAQRKPSCAFFSYSWLEMKIEAQSLKEFDLLIFIEPSTQVVARALQGFRQELIDIGYHPVAPCTHEKGCPLLIHSQRDWCHDRVHFEKPDWFLDLESRLPMKNNTLTFSYLVMSKTAIAKTTGQTRVIGDTMKEKGKTKQAICFDEQRRFLSWLKKEEPNPPHIDHGALIQIEDPQTFGNEVRSKKIIY